MKVDRNVDLYSQNTMRLHSIADTVYYPESTNDLMEVLGQNKTDCLILAAGSNVILPERLHRPVISLMSLNESLEVLDDGRAHVGCSVRVQKLIRFLQDNGLGGIEYLYSVPASLGGLVYMNGGRGKKYNMSIADYLDEVEYLDLDDMTAKTMRVRRADFTYRHSPFQDMNAIILSAFFRFKAQDANDTEALIKERLAFSKQYLSADKPSCGSVYKKGNKLIFRLLKGMRAGGAMFSRKTANWISNMGDATSEDVCRLIRRGQTLHRLFFCQCEPEVKIVKE
ncbi:MAG: FAD-binding protein [Bacteroidales bacterium]|nr:FAD-binding protein [Bacteroidales bacterium]